jgi:hypothetical protein
MRVWLLQGRQGEDPGGLRPLLRQWADRPASVGCRLDYQPLGPDLSARVQAHRPLLLVFAAACGLPRATVEEVLALDAGLVVATEEGRPDPYLELAERYPVLVVPARPTPEVVDLALWGALAAVRRQQYWKTQVEQLNQRLNDRIVIERAKGVLVQRLGIGEEEAYKRLRLLSRRQRRQIRDIAQSLLDARELLLPPANGVAGPEPPQAPTPAGDPPAALPETDA